MAHVLGKDCKLYRNTGTHASPTWNLVDNVKDLSLAVSGGEVDVSTRETSFKLTDVALSDLELSFGMLHDSANTDYTALLAAFNARTAIEFAVMDGAIATTGNVGYRAFMKCTAADHGQPLEDSFMVDFTWKPTRYLEASAIVVPDYYTVP